MSDDGEIDVESDEVTDMMDMNRNSGKHSDLMEEGMGVDKRAHHNALERKRRDHIKDSFTSLRDCIPAMSGEKVSRAHILNKATEYIRQMQRCSATRTVEIDDLKKKNEILEEQIHALEQAKASGSSIDNPEDLIASIADKVQQRQSLRIQNQQNSKNNPKLQLESTGDGRNTSTDSFSLASVTDPPPSSINVLANNIRTTQNLLNALAKNLPTNTTNPQVRSLAARVLASPLRQPTGGTVMPRGVVTATAVPPSFQTSTVAQQVPLSQSNGAGINAVNISTIATSQQQTASSLAVRQSISPAPPTVVAPSHVDVASTLSLLVNSLPESVATESLLSIASSVTDEATASITEGLDVDSLMNNPHSISSALDTSSNVDELPPSKRAKTSDK